MQPTPDTQSPPDAWAGYPDYELRQAVDDYVHLHGVRQTREAFEEALKDAMEDKHVHA